MTYVCNYGGGIGPSIGGFIEFVQNVMQPPNPPFDPTTSIYVTYAYNGAYQWVYQGLGLVPGIPGAWNTQALSTYNLAADFLIQIAQDQPGDPIFKDSLAYWAYLRKLYNVLAFFPGVVQSTSDEGTSAGYLVPNQFQNFSVADLQALKTPYGRTYLGYAQSWGPVWGAS